MFRRLVLGAGLVSVMFVGVAAATKFGSDDSGFLPPDKATTTCENAVGKSVAKLVACINKCHAARAAGKLTDDASEEACEENNAGKSCKERFVAALGKLSAKCPGQCSINNSTGNTILTLVDSNNNLVYCNGTDAFGSDDTGVLPPAGDKTTVTCENAVGKNVGKLVACVGKCHAARASLKITDDAGEDACETNNAGKSCKERFVAAMGKLGPKCPGQCSVTNGADNGPSGTSQKVLDLVNGANNLVYCASPSGAFLQ